jgi:hypothetical protein
MNGPKFSIETPGVKAEGALLQEFRREVAQLLDRHSLGFPGAQPCKLCKKTPG